MSISCQINYFRLQCKMSIRAGNSRVLQNTVKCLNLHTTRTNQLFKIYYFNAFLLVSSHWLFLVFASHMSMFADLSVMTAKRSPSLSQPKQQHIPGRRTWINRYRICKEQLVQFRHWYGTARPTVFCTHGCDVLIIWWMTLLPNHNLRFGSKCI